MSFLKAHVITVSDKEGYHNYHIDPKYKFENLDACREFQSTLRERDLFEAFDAIEISEARTIVARRQVIRLWQRNRKNELAIATMTFFLSSFESKKHREVDLADYSATTKCYTPIFKRQSESDTIELVPSVSARNGTKVVRVKFGSAKGACQSANFLGRPADKTYLLTHIPSRQRHSSSKSGSMLSILIT